MNRDVCTLNTLVPLGKGLGMIEVLLASLRRTSATVSCDEANSFQLEEAVCMNPTVWSVLLVDDSAAVRQALRRLFEVAGFECSESENGADALNQAKRLKPSLIILDFSMPIMNGIEAAPLLKKVVSETPIIMFTMFASRELERLAVAAGVNAVFHKDPGTSGLVPKALSLLESK